MHYCPSYGYPDCLNQVLEWLWVVFNIGGPMSRTRTEKVSSCILGNRNSSIQWPRLHRVGIMFPKGVSPREYMEDFMARNGFAAPDDCKYRVTLPSGSYFCRTVQGDEAVRINPVSEKPVKVLRAALILGLCNNNCYNAERPVIWTDGRLSRMVELYDVGRFYEND